MLRSLSRQSRLAESFRAMARELGRRAADRGASPEAATRGSVQRSVKVLRDGAVEAHLLAGLLSAL